MGSNFSGNFRPANDIVFKLSCWFIVMFPVFLRLPIGLGFRYDIVLRAPALLPLLFVILLQLLYIKKHSIRISLSFKDIPVGMFFAIWIVAIFRTTSRMNLFDAILVLYDLLTFVIVVCLVYFSFLLASEHQAFVLRRCVILAFGLYIALNLILYWIGIQPDNQIYHATYPAQILSWLGITTNRVLFPMTDGINYFGLLSGAVLVASVFLLTDNNWLPGRIASIFLALVSFITILMTDSRGAIVFSFSTVLLLLIFRRFSRFLFGTVIIISILPVVLTALVPGLHYDIFYLLQRPKSNWVEGPPVEAENELCELLLAQSSGLLSNRPVIWKIVLDELIHPRIIHMIGYGYRGQVVSNLSSRYSCLFRSYVFGGLASSHNLWLQTWIDIGYVGVLVTLGFSHALLGKLSNLLNNSSDSAYRSMLGVIIYIMLIGSLEASISPDFNMLFIFVCLISVVSLFGVSPANRKPVR